MYGARAFSNPWSGMGHEGMLRVYLFAKLHRDENVAPILYCKGILKIRKRRLK